jgi:hypothetical protein
MFSAGFLMLALWRRYGRFTLKVGVMAALWTIYFDSLLIDWPFYRSLNHFITFHTSPPLDPMPH